MDCEEVAEVDLGVSKKVLKKRLIAEEAHSADLAQEVEELQQEVDRLRQAAAASASKSRARFPQAQELVLDPSSPSSPSSLCGPTATPRAGTPSPAGTRVDRRHSMHILSKEVDQSLQDRLHRISYAPSPLRKTAAKKERGAFAPPSRNQSDIEAFALREERLKSELDDEGARSWQLEKDLLEARKEVAGLRDQVSSLTLEMREQQTYCELREAEVTALHGQVEEMTNAAQVVSRPPSCGPSRQTPSGALYGGRSLLRDIQAAELLGQDDPNAAQGPPISPVGLQLYQQVEELRAQLMNAEFESQRRQAGRHCGGVLDKEDNASDSQRPSGPVEGATSRPSRLREATTVRRRKPADTHGAPNAEERRRSLRQHLLRRGRLTRSGLDTGFRGSEDQASADDTKACQKSLLRSSWPEAFRAR